MPRYLDPNTFEESCTYAQHTIAVHVVLAEDLEARYILAPLTTQDVRPSQAIRRYVSSDVGQTRTRAFSVTTCIDYLPLDLFSNG